MTTVVAQHVRLLPSISQRLRVSFINLFFADQSLPHALRIRNRRKAGLVVAQKNRLSGESMQVIELGTVEFCTTGLECDGVSPLISSI